MVTGEAPEGVGASRSEQAEGFPETIENGPTGTTGSETGSNTEAE